VATPRVAPSDVACRRLKVRIFARIKFQRGGKDDARPRTALSESVGEHQPLSELVEDSNVLSESILRPQPRRGLGRCFVQRSILLADPGIVRIVDGFGQRRQESEGGRPKGPEKDSGRPWFGRRLPTEPLASVTTRAPERL
jgi:hypothetical protein